MIITMFQLLMSLTQNAEAQPTETKKTKADSKKAATKEVKFASTGSHTIGTDTTAEDIITSTDVRIVESKPVWCRVVKWRSSNQWLCFGTVSSLDDCRGWKETWDQDQPGDLRGLARLPVGVVEQIASLLPRESRAALALANRQILAILGRVSLNLPAQRQRTDFLQLLARDLPRLPYCHRCRLLHTPGKHRGSPAARLLCNAAANEAVAGVDFEATFEAMKSYHAGKGSYAELLRCLAGDKELPGRMFMGGMVGVYEAGIAQGPEGLNLVAKTEYIWLPPNARLMSPGALCETRKLIVGLSPICRHWTWREAYEVFFPDGDRLDDFHREGDLDHRHRDCPLFHAEQPCKTCKEFNTVRSCELCYTDFCIASTDLMKAPSSYPRCRSLFFTTWKNLGQGESRDDPMWRSHMATDSFIPPPSEPGKQYQLHEGVEAQKSYVYSPVFPPQVVREILELFESDKRRAGC